eukprot:TRINITY_DN7895_c0_g1_i2.p1 TRINITY_DN7895_c0_g1~~TRINITY_DN7895_c0_g1_i2.p1  ORF type:complete len:309 (+),score=120.51 TRINITY_DN7895_c0_g1_i2:62-988(+)
MEVEQTGTHAGSLREAVASLRAFLATKKVDDLLVQDILLFAVDSNDSLENAMRLLTQNKIQSAPVYDENRNGYPGFVDLLDIVAFIVDNFQSNKSTLGSDIAEQAVAYRWQNTKVVDIVDISQRNPFTPVLRGTPLPEVLELIAREAVPRVPVVESGFHRGTDLFGVLGQSKVVRFLADHLSEMSPALRAATVEGASLGTSIVVYTNATDTVLDAFRSILDMKIAGLPIVDADSGVLLGNLSAHDVKLLTATRDFGLLGLDVMSYSARVRQAFPTRLPPAVYVLGTDTLETVLRVLDDTAPPEIYTVS